MSQSDENDVNVLTKEDFITAIDKILDKVEHGSVEDNEGFHKEYFYERVRREPETLLWELKWEIQRLGGKPK